VLNVSDGVQVDARRVISNMIEKGKIPHSKIFYAQHIPQDITDFRKAKWRDVRNQLMGTNATKLILFAGRLAKQKNVLFLLGCFHDIAAKFPEARLVIIGEGPEESNLRREADELGIVDKIDWIRFVPASKLAEYLHAADIFVLCSLFEGTPRVLMEAAMAGKPIVSADVGGVEAVVKQGKSGYIVPQGDRGKFVERVLFLLNNPEIARRMGRTGRQVVTKQLDPQKMVARQIEVWDKIISRVHDQAMNEKRELMYQRMSEPSRVECVSSHR
jgi:glycosyltransferase involved in cell wall biosynthesis